MAESKYKFDDAKAAFAEAEKRIQQALKSGVEILSGDGLGHDPRNWDFAMAGDNRQGHGAVARVGFRRAGNPARHASVLPHAERSLYVVVLNGRAGAEDEDAEYWLKFVKTFGASSPTIVVLNKSKVQPFQVNRRALQEKYPFIRAFVETDCKPKTNNGIPELKREIESALAAMEHVRADFPAGWFQIKERLAELKEPFISFAEYRKICAGLGENDALAQERLAGFLNALGIALNFREDQQLREETVLNPHWITEGVYQIITSKALAERQGELRLADLGRILTARVAAPRQQPVDRVAGVSRRIDSQSAANSSSKNSGALPRRRYGTHIRRGCTGSSSS